MERKTALVTGANSGMGFETALALAGQGIHVVLACRNRARGEAALAKIRSSGGDAELMLCDLADMADIRRFCAEFRQRHGRLDILVNNAGVLCVTRQETRDGLEMHFGVCHIGHFLLTNLLLDLIPPGGRIVVVGSVAHKSGRIDFDDLPMRKGYSVAKAYSRAKLCNMLFTAELARRLRGSGVTVNCAHPGAVITNIGARRKEGAMELSRLRRVAGAALRLFVKTARQGAATAIYLATSPECEGVTGGYFADCRPAEASAQARDEALARRLWEVSERITGLGENAR